MRAARKARKALSEIELDLDYAEWTVEAAEPWTEPHASAQAQVTALRRELKARADRVDLAETAEAIQREALARATSDADEEIDVRARLEYMKETAAEQRRKQRHAERRKWLAARRLPAEEARAATIRMRLRAEAWQVERCAAEDEDEIERAAEEAEEAEREERIARGAAEFERAQARDEFEEAAAEWADEECH